MRVLVCPDKFAGTLSAVRAAAAIAAGWSAAAPGDEVTCRPLADGGPGFLDVLRAALGGAGARDGAPPGTTEVCDGATPGGSADPPAGPVVPSVVPPAGGTTVTMMPAPTVDPLGRPASAQVLLAGVPGEAGATAYLESAQACGLHLLAPRERDPKRTTSYGLGLLLVAAVEYGATRIVVGLGGSGTNDAGAGMLAALDAAPLDEAGYALPYGGGALAGCHTLGGIPRLRPVQLVAATDVDNPLTGPHGASVVFGPQKGATAADVALLDPALARFAQVLERGLPGCPAGLADRPGAGAAGGLGAALLALGGRITSGIGLVRELTGLDSALDRADLVITGEGSFDGQSLRGKLVSGVAAAAARRGLPCLVLAGRVAVDPHLAARAGVTEAHSLVAHLGGVEEAMTRPADGLRSLAGMLAGRWPVRG